MLYKVLYAAKKVLYTVWDMVKADSKRINMRLRSGVRFMLEELCDRWGCGQTEAMERAIGEAHGKTGGIERTERAGVRGVSLPVQDLEMVPIDEA